MYQAHKYNTVKANLRSILNLEYESVLSDCAEQASMSEEDILDKFCAFWVQKKKQKPRGKAETRGMAKYFLKWRYNIIDVSKNKKQNSLKMLEKLHKNVNDLYHKSSEWNDELMWELWRLYDKRNHPSEEDLMFVAKNSADPNVGRGRVILELKDILKQWPIWEERLRQLRQ